jgi:type IV pilus assembly protein PilN
MAQTNERVSEFLRNTGGRSTWLERPELVEIKASNQSVKDARAAKRMFEFTMRVTLKQPASEENADAASRPRGAGKPAGQS